jgi:predicted esterase
MAELNPSTVTAEHVASLSVADIKGLLAKVGVTDTRGCLDKDDLVKLFVSSRDARAAEATGGKSITALVRQLYPGALEGRDARLSYGEVAYVGNTKNPTAIVSFCHGLGDTCDGWAAGMADEVAPHLPHVLFVLPTAAQQPVSMNMGMRMPAWYDIKGLGPRSEEDPEGVLLSAAHVERLVQAACEKHNVPRSRVVFAGFSQGAALSLTLGLLTKDAPAGICALSGYLAAREAVVPHQKNAETVPIVMFHGTADPVVPLQLAQMSVGVLQSEMKAKVELKQYRGMAHSSSPAEMRDFVAQLKTWLP